MVPTVGGATPSVSFRRREDFRSAVPARRAQFPRVGRRGKKLERSTRVCRLRRPCDTSGQCQRCRSPPRRRRRRRAPRRMHPTIGERRHGRNPLAHDARVKNPWQSSRNFSPPRRCCAIDVSFSKLEFLSSATIRFIHSYYCYFIIIIVSSRADLSALLTRDYIVSENILERELSILWSGLKWCFKKVSTYLNRTSNKHAIIYILTVQNHVVMLHALMDRLFHACSSVSITPSRTTSYTTYPVISLSRKYFQ